MKKTILLVLVICTALFSVAIANDFEDAVEDAAKGFTAAFEAKDAASIGSLYAQDAIAFPPNAEMVKGREAIQAFWKGLIDAGMKAKVEVLETESEDDMGSEVGKYTIFDPSGKIADVGKYVVVWKKGKDGWKLYRDIWNSNMPVVAPAK